MAGEDLTRVDFALLKGGEEGLRQILAKLKEELKDLEGYLNQHTQEWEGDAVQAYHQAKKVWDGKVEEVNMVLLKMSNAVNSAHENYARTEAKVTQSWG